MYNAHIDTYYDHLDYEDYKRELGVEAAYYEPLPEWVENDWTDKEWTNEDEAALERWEEERRIRIAEAQEW